MKRMHQEIGSEFWEEDLLEQQNDFLQLFHGDIKHMMSGKAATRFVLEELTDRDYLKKAYLPAYTCETVIEPFLKTGYEVRLYDVDNNLMPLLDYGVIDEISVFLFHGYYGFPLYDKTFLSECTKKGVRTIHDVTHTMFSGDGIDLQADYVVGSVRKWFGVAAGGIAVSRMEQFQTKPTAYIDDYIRLRNEALRLKRNYIEGKAEDQKQTYLKLFTSALNYLIEQAEIQSSDDESVNVVTHFDVSDMKRRRRENFAYLLKNVAQSSAFAPVISELPDEVCPLYFPAYSTKREEIRNRLIQDDIYPPIHWPVPPEIDLSRCPGTARVYDTVFSIPCDQRYDTADMKRIVEVLKCFK